MRGITVTLYERTQTGWDPFNAPVFTDQPVAVDNVIVAPMSDDEVLQTYTLTGRRAVYQMGIPKGDTHEWAAGRRVDFFGESWRIIGMPQEGIEELIPLSWNKKVRVERYEQGQI